VPSPHWTIVPVVFAAWTTSFASAFTAFAAALVRAASTPPCPEQAPRPLEVEGEPSLHIVEARWPDAGMEKETTPMATNESSWIRMQAPR
jgi:hypothetical protein